MKKVQITYWVTTILLSLLNLLAGIMYLTSAETKLAFPHLGFPGYFRIELAIAKLLGVTALLLPAVKGRVKEWAYFGFFIVFVSAFIAHISVGDPVGKWGMALFSIALLLVSYFSYHHFKKGE